MLLQVQVHVPIHSLGRGGNTPAVAGCIMCVCVCVSTSSKLLVYLTYEWCAAWLTYKVHVYRRVSHVLGCVLPSRMLWCHAAAAKRWRFRIWKTRDEKEGLEEAHTAARVKRPGDREMKRNRSARWGGEGWEAELRAPVCLV